jgi:hypothetical protein
MHIFWTFCDGALMNLTYSLMNLKIPHRPPEMAAAAAVVAGNVAVAAAQEQSHPLAPEHIAWAAAAGNTRPAAVVAAVPHKVAGRVAGGTPSSISSASSPSPLLQDAQSENT